MNDIRKQWGGRPRPSDLLIKSPISASAAAMYFLEQNARGVVVYHMANDFRRVDLSKLKNPDIVSGFKLVVT